MPRRFILYNKGKLYEGSQVNFLKKTASACYLYNTISQYSFSPSFNNKWSSYTGEFSYIYIDVAREYTGQTRKKTLKKLLKKQTIVTFILNINIKYRTRCHIFNLWSLQSVSFDHILWMWAYTRSICIDSLWNFRTGST